MFNETENSAIKTIDGTIGEPSFTQHGAGEQFDERTAKERAARFRASADMLFRTDVSRLDDISADALYRSATEGMFGIADKDGTFAFGKRAAKDAKGNIELMRRFLKGEWSLIEDPEYKRWREMDEETKFRYALEHEGDPEKIKSWAKGERGAGLWEQLAGGLAISAPGLPAGAMAATQPEHIRKQNEAVAKETGRRSNYESLTDEEKAQYRTDVIGDYERKLSRQETLEAFLRYSQGLNDKAAYLLAKSLNSGELDATNIELLRDKEQRDRVYSAFAAIRGPQKKGRILGIETDFTDGTGWNRFQLGLYGLQQSVLGLVTDTGEFATDLALKAYSKAAMDEQERKEFWRGRDATIRAERAMKQGLPEPDSLFGWMFQGVMENGHWFIPYGLLAGKGTKWFKGANATIKAAKADAATLSTAMKIHQGAALERYTKALQAIPKEIATARAVRDVGAGMWLTGEAMAFSAFAEEYMRSADAAGVSREESVFTAAAVGLINATIERLYVPGMESTLTPTQLKSMMWRSALEAVRSDGAAGFKKYLFNRIPKDLAQFARVATTEGIIEEPLQQMAIEHGKAFDLECQKLREEGKTEAADKADAFFKSVQTTLAQDWGTFVDTAAESLPTALGFGLTSVGNMKARQHYHDIITRHANRRAGSTGTMAEARSVEELYKAADYESGMADWLQQAMDIRTTMEKQWGEGEKNPNRFAEAMTAARRAYRNTSTGDMVQEIADAAGVDVKTAEALVGYFQVEDEATAFSPKAKAVRDVAMSLADIDEKTIASLMPGYIEGSWAADAEKGVYSGRVRLGDGTERTIAYRIGDLSELSRKYVEQQSKLGSQLGASFDARHRSLGDGVTWESLTEAQRYTAALTQANGFSGGENGVFELKDANGETVVVNADDVINLANGRLGDIGYGPAATQGTVRHETFHSLWRFARGTMEEEDVKALAKSLGVDTASEIWENDLDEAMAVEMEQYASGHWVSNAAQSRFDKMLQGWAGKLIDFIGKASAGDEVINPKTGKPYALKGLYDSILKGEIGSGAFGVELRKSGAAPAPEVVKESTRSENGGAPVEVTDEERAKHEAEERQAAAAGTQNGDVGTENANPGTQNAVPETPAATAENPADAATPNQRYYKIGLPNSEVTLVGRLEVRDAATGLTTSTDAEYHDRANQNRDDTSEESRALVEKIGANPDPLQIGTVQPIANNGIVWALPNGDVIIGNHRVNGVRLAYRKGTAAALEKFVREDASKRGIEIGDDLKNPMPVFILERIESPDGKADMHEVVRLANESQNRGFNVREQAQNDAKILQNGNLLPRMAFRPDGRIDETKSGDAIGRFRQESGAQGMVAEDGTLTEEGQTRIQNAALAALLAGSGSNALLQKIMSNAGLLDMSSELRALMKMTPELMALAEAKPAFDLRQPLAEALQLFAEWREKDETARVEKGKTRHDWRETAKDGHRVRGISWEAFMSQGDMFRTPSEEARILGDLFARAESLRSFDREDVESAAGKKRVIDFISQYIEDYIENAKAVNTETEDMFGAPPPSRAEVMSTQRAKGEEGPRFSVAVEEGISQDEAKDRLRSQRGNHTNRRTGITARLSADGAGKLVSNAAVAKTVANGFTAKQHNELAANIGVIFADASLAEDRPDRNGDTNIRSIKRFVTPVSINGQEAVAWTTVKESTEHGHRIYSVEGIKIAALSPAVRRVLANRNSADNAPTQESISNIGGERQGRFSIGGIYTGSAADYDKPSIQYIGTGEGNQVYGWGLYGSTKRSVANWYARQGGLEKANLKLDYFGEVELADILNIAKKNGRPIAKADKDISEENLSIEQATAYYIFDEDSVGGAIQFVEKWIERLDERLKTNDDKSKEIKTRKAKLLEILNELRQHGHEYTFGNENIYEQTWFTNREPGDESHLLKWYEPVSEEQRGWIQDQLLKEHIVTPEAWGAPREDGVFVNYTGPIVNIHNGGDSLYGSLTKLFGSPKAASEFLARAGIDGVKYPVDSYGKTVKDGDEVGWNYVAFSDENIRVDHKWTDGVQRFSISGIYTGSAADYEKPSVKYIGTGEGSQVYGWGLYGSNVRGVAESYAASAKRDKAITQDEETFQAVKKVLGKSVSEDILQAIYEGVTGNSDWGEVKAWIKRDAEWDDEIGPKMLSVFRKKESELKKVHEQYAAHEQIYEQTWFTNREPGDESHLLKWYEPVSEEQLKWIRDALVKEKNIRDYSKTGYGNVLVALEHYLNVYSLEGDTRGITGETVYKAIDNVVDKDPKAASEFLYRAGIDGVKYPVDSYAKTVKNGDEVGWNYVAFSDENIRVDHKWTDGEQRFSISGIYTGSAADYEKPSLHHVGTGEGSQVYGWGLYGSTERSVAEGYANRGRAERNRSRKQNDIFIDGKKQPGTNTPEGIAATTFDEAEGDRGKAIATLRANVERMKGWLSDGKIRGERIEGMYRRMIANEQGAIKLLEDKSKKFTRKVNSPTPNANLYEQTFFTDREPGDESHLLKWYEPISKETWDIIREGVKAIGDTYEESHIDRRDNSKHSELFWKQGHLLERDGKPVYLGSTTGQSFYKDLAIALGSPKAASEYLAKIGIDGVKYPVDSYGKTVKDGDVAGWNYVSFRDDNIRVDHKWTDGQMRYSIAQTETPQFKAWFGDWENDPANASKVVDRAGRPRVVYHGTPNGKFWTFDKNRIGETWGADETGFFFTSDKHIAEDYTKPYFRENSADPNLLAVYLSIKNPLVIDRNWWQAQFGRSDIHNHDAVEIWDTEQQAILDAMRKGGHDGVIIDPNPMGGAAKMYMVPEPTQIKSATDNIGTFDSTNPDIRYSISEPVKRHSSTGNELADAMIRKGRAARFSVASEQPELLERPAIAYPQIRTMGDDELLAAAIASRMALSKSDKISDRSVTINTVQRLMKRLHPEMGTTDIGRESLRVLSDAKKLGKRIREDLDRGVSESKILKYLPETARETFGREIRQEARRGAALGEFGEKAAQELEERKARVIENAVRVQTGLDADMLESAFGINLSDTLMRIAENPMPENPAKPVPPAGGEAAGATGVVSSGGGEDVAAKASEAVMAIVETAKKYADENAELRKERKDRQAENASAADEGAEGAGNLQDAGGGDIVATATRKAGLDLENPRHLAELVAELTRRYWIKEHSLALNADVWRDPVAVQFLRKTAESVYSKLIRDLTYSRGRETATQHIARLASIPTVNGLLSEMEFIGAIINARKIHDTQKAMCERLDLFLRKEFGAQGRFRPDKEEGKRNVSTEAELRARYMRYAMRLTPQAASEEAMKLAQTLDSLAVEFDEAGRDVDQSRLHTETVRKLGVLREFGALRYKPVGEIEAAIRWWEDFARGDSDEILREQADRDIRTKKAAHLLAVAFADPDRKTAREGGVADLMNKYITGHMSFISLLQDCARHASDADRAAAQPIVDWLAREIQKSGDRSEAEKRRHNDAFHAAVEKIYGRRFNAVMKEMMAEDERFTKYMGVVGGKRVVPTKARAMQLLVSLLQEGRRIEVEDEDGTKSVVWEGGYHDNIVKHKRQGQAAELLKLMSPADMNMVKWMGEWYEANRSTLSEVCENLFGIGVYAELPNYFPVKMMLEKQGLEKGEGVGWTIFPKALTPRVKNERDFDTSADIFSMWASRMEEAAQWKHHAQLGLELRGIFGRAELREAVRANHGASADELMQGFITDILSGHGAYDRSTAGVQYFSDQIRGWTALCALGGNVGVMLKQPTSIPAFGFEIGLVNTAKYMVNAFTPEGMAAMRRIWDSEQRRTRWQVGSSEAVRNALNQQGAGALKRMFQASMITNKLGDVVPALVVGQGIYRDCLARGMSEEDALAQTWSIIERTQQSGRMENQTSIQRRNKLGRIMFQFLSTQQQYLQYELRAIREVIANPTSVKRWGNLARTIILNHFILSSAYFWMGELYKAMLGQEPPEDELKDWVITCLLGPYGSLLVAGFCCKYTLERALKGYSIRGGSSMLPMVSWLKNQINDGARLLKAIFDAEGDTLDAILDAAGRWASDSNSTVRDLRKIYRFRIKGEK